MQLSIVTGFIQSRQLPPDLVESIMSQFSDLGRVETRDASIVFDKLSNSLQVEVARCTSKRVVERVPIMAGCNANFLDALVVLLRVGCTAT